MNNEDRFSASASTVPAPVDGTPPERHIRLPLTPPATDEWQSTSNPQSPVSAVLDFITQRQHHQLADQSQQLKFTSLDYKKLLARLEEHPGLKSFVDNKLRLDYDPLEEVLHAPPMPTAIHERFLEQVSQETKAQLDHIASGNDEAARFAARIFSVRSGSIQLREFDSDNDIGIDPPYIQRQPDEQFQHKEAEYPGVVYEIAYSQDARGLGKAAWTYIPYSNGDIKAVVGFDLGYGKSKEARISMWQPRYLLEGEDGVEILDVEAVIDRDLFRSSDGSATNTTKTLHLPLDCFATSEVATFQSEGLPGITIAYAKLAEFLDEAESVQQIRQPALGEQSRGKKSIRHTKKRRRSSTPTEQLSSDREREFRDAEGKVEARTAIEDSDFQHQTRDGVDIPERRQSRRMR